MNRKKFPPHLALAIHCSVAILAPCLTVTLLGGTTIDTAEGGFAK